MNVNGLNSVVNKRKAAQEQTEEAKNKINEDIFKRITVGLPKEIHQQLKIIGVKEDKYINEIIINLITDYVNNYKK